MNTGELCIDFQCWDFQDLRAVLVGILVILSFFQFLNEKMRHAQVSQHEIFILPKIKFRYIKFLVWWDVMLQIRLFFYKVQSFLFLSWRIVP